MPKMKYFQPVADIRNTYDDLLVAYAKPDNIFSEIQLQVRHLTFGDEALVMEEIDVLKYILACQNGLAYGSDHNLKKPSIEAVNRCFNRHLNLIDEIYSINASNVNTNDNALITKQYKACRHYIFKFSLPGWVKHLPEEIITFENKYPKN